MLILQRLESNRFFTVSLSNFEQPFIQKNKDEELHKETIQD